MLLKDGLRKKNALASPALEQPRTRINLLEHSGMACAFASCHVKAVS